MLAHAFVGKPFHHVSFLVNQGVYSWPLPLSVSQDPRAGAPQREDSVAFLVEGKVASHLHGPCLGCRAGTLETCKGVLNGLIT